MSAEVIGSAQVLIEADFSNFDESVQRQLVSAAKRAGAAAEKELKSSSKRAGKGFADGVNQAASSTKTLDAIRGSIEKLETAAKRAGDTQVDAAERVRVAQANLAKVQRTTDRVTIDGIEKHLAAENKLAKAQRDAARVNDVVAAASRALATARGKLAVESSRAGEDAGKALSAGLQRGASKDAGRAGARVGALFSKAFGSNLKLPGTRISLFTAVIAGVVAALSPLPTLLGGGAAAAVALAGALATSSGAAISLLGVLGALGLAAGALNAGFSGVGDAVKAQAAAQAELAETGKISEATQKKLDAALSKLAPSAQAVVKQLSAMAPAWQRVTRSVQGALFAGVSQSLANLGNRFLPILNKQLTATATTLNGTAQGFARFLNTSSRASQINSIFTGLNGILKTLLAPLTTVAGGFLDIFQKSLPFAQALATTLSGMGTRFGEFLSESASSGAFTTFMETASKLAGSLFDLLGNIASIIGSVFGAGTEAGGDLLSILARLTQTAADFFNSTEGKEALAGFFSLIAEAGGILVGVFKTLSPLLQGIGALFQALQAPLKVFGAALTGVFGQLATVIGGALAQLGPVLGQLLVALAPVVTILGGVLSGVIAALVPVILQLVTSFAQLLPSLTPLIAIIGAALVGAIQQFAGLLVQILPVLVQFITAIAAGLQPVLAAIAPVLAQVVAAFVQLVVALLPILTSLLPLVPAFAQLSLAVTQLILALAPLVTSILLSLTSLLIQLAPHIAALVPHILRFVTALVGIVQAVTRVVTAVVAFAVRVQASFNQTRGAVIAAVAAMISGVVGFFSGLPGRVNSLMTSFANVVKAGIDRAVQFFLSLPGRVTSAIAGLQTALFTAGAQAVQGLVNGIRSKAGEVAAAAKDLASKVSGGIGKLLDIHSPSRVTYKQGEEAGQGLANGLLNKIKAVTSAATTLANAVPSAVAASVGKLNTALGSLGSELPATIRKRLASVVASSKVGIASVQRASAVLDAKLAASQKNLQSLLEKSQQLAASVAQGILATGNIAQGQGVQSFTDIVNRLKSAVTQAKQFNATIAALSKAGLNRTSLQQIIDAGPEAGTAAGKAVLAAGKAGVNQINTLQAQLQKAASAAAKTASNAIFGQGIQIANGIVAGLRKQRANLDAVMLRLADVLVRRVLVVLRGVKLKSGGTLNIPGFADGGVVSRDQLIRAGEKNKPEAIVPLTKPRRAQQIMDQTGLSSLQGGGKSKTVEVPIHVAGNVVDYAALTTHIEKVLTRFGLVPKLGIVTSGGSL